MIVDHTTTSTHRNEPVLRSPLQARQHGTNQHRASGCDGVPQSHCATVYIYLRRIQSQIANELRRHYSKSLIHLEEINIIERHGRSLNTFRAAGTGSTSELDLRLQLPWP